MTKDIKGLDLCKGFFFDCAKPILDKFYTNLQYSAGLIGYGSDVLGYDDATSRDHMWGPRFYLFVTEKDSHRKQEIFETFSSYLPYQYQGFSVNFTQPDMLDCGVQHPAMIDSGSVNPLIFIQTIDEFLTAELGTASLTDLQPLDWLAFSEHRLLSLVAGTLFVDRLNLAEKIAVLRYYPEEVRNFLIASNWDMIASEQAFVKRCGECGDEIGSILIASRIAERLMRLCFLYREVYAPYSKWFGTAFARLDIDKCIGASIASALTAHTVEEREKSIVRAQALVADLHNASGITEPVAYQIESYYGRDIQVIFADKFAQATAEKLKGTALASMALIGSLSQVGGFSAVSDDYRWAEQIKSLYDVK